MRKQWNALLLSIGLFLGFLRKQLINWPTSIRTPLRAGLMVICTAFAAKLYSLFRELPHGWDQALLDNIGDPRAIVISGYLAMIFAMATGYSYVADKLRRSL
ncbi:hypothetical protein [Pseudomarimonas arenosa]|uniref:Uncharacterized protein n=1 Tax=Pseudomarimonas arenosa TaxID=2774145 RepID=A0AAW3ZRN8_9GAMM|nr:hypothetical protein [Pseudomarimonas arenosa]MBD8528200.1 hypothetical protein [Pseudomarimonas arenosa]